MTHSTLRCIACCLLDITDSLRLGQRPGERISPTEIEEQATRWANRRPQSHDRRRRLFLRHATRWLQFLQRWQPPPMEPRRYADYVAVFADSMHRERGLSPSPSPCAAVSCRISSTASAFHCLWRKSRRRTSMSS